MFPAVSILQRILELILFNIFEYSQFAKNDTTSQARSWIYVTYYIIYYIGVSNSTYINSYNDHNKPKIIKCQVLSKTIAINYLKDCWSIDPE